MPLRPMYALEAPLMPFPSYCEHNQGDNPRRRRPIPLPSHHPSLTRLQWKVLVVDEESRKIIDNVVKEDDILNENITSAHAQLPSLRTFA